MKKLLYLVIIVIFSVLAHNAKGKIATLEYERGRIDMYGIDICGTRVYKKTSKSDLLRAISCDTTLTADESLAYSYKVMIDGDNPYLERMDKMQQNADEMITSLVIKRNIYSFIAIIFGIFLIVSLFRTEKH